MSPFTVVVGQGELHGSVVGSGPPLLVLHGGPGTNDYSAMFADELTGWTALCYTQRGVPPSIAPGPYSVDVHVADALAVLDHHGIERATVLGHSWGAFLACCLAAAAPERVRGLVLVDGLGLAGDGGEAEFAAALMAATPPEVVARAEELDERALRGEGTEDDALESMRLLWPSYFADPATAPSPPDGMRLSVQCYAETFASVRTVQAEGRTAERLRDFAGPVEVVHGASGPVPARAVRETAALFADSVVTALPGAGHMVWFEEPGSITAALDRLAVRLPS